MELLIRVRDSYPLTGDDEFDSKVSRRGDVIVAQPDGWQWGARELDNPDWRILKLPNISKAMADSLVSAEVAQSEDPDPTLQFRGFQLNIDLSALPAALKAYLRDNTRAAPSYTLNIDDNYIINNAVKVQKARWDTQKSSIQ